MYSYFAEARGKRRIMRATKVDGRHFSDIAQLLAALPYILLIRKRSEVFRAVVSCVVGEVEGGD